MDLGELIEYIDRKSRTSTLVAEPELAPLAAEIEAERLLVDAEDPGGMGMVPVGCERIDGARGARCHPMVKEAVAVQMESVTAPESQLVYGKIPNGADDDEVQKEIRKNFELRIGASDVTAYHDFHTLQIAFQHVWTRIFDGQLTTLGQDLYREYVRLKDFSGSTAADMPVGSLEDLRRLMDEIKKLSQFVDEETPTTCDRREASPRPADCRHRNLKMLPGVGRRWRPAVPACSLSGPSMSSSRPATAPYG